MQILQQGPGFLHAIMPQIEEGVTHILAVNNGKVTLHRILQTGEVLSQDMNMTLVRSILAAVDSVVPAGV